MIGYKVGGRVREGRGIYPLCQPDMAGRLRRGQDKCGLEPDLEHYGI